MAPFTNSGKDVIPPPPASVAKSTTSTRSNRVHIPSNNVRGPRGLIAAYKKQQADDAHRIVIAKRNAYIRTCFVYLALFVVILAYAAYSLGIVPAIWRHSASNGPTNPEQGFAPSPPPPIPEQGFAKSMGIVPVNGRYPALNNAVTPPPPTRFMGVVPATWRFSASKGPADTPPPPPPPPQALLELADI